MKISSEEQMLVETARRVLPGGIFGNIASEIIIRDGRAGRVRDVSGNEYIDYLLGSGPMLVGHAHPEVNAAVTEQLSRGTTFFANNEYGIMLAGEIVDALPCAEQVRFASSGSEANALAMRLVRAFRGRSKILKFEGGFLGMSDYALMSTAPLRPGNSERPTADSAGIPESVQNEMVVAPFNDLAAAQQLIHKYRDELAGVMLEPLQRLLPPVPGFLQGLRDITAELGIPLIFDEVVTGFRLAYGGAQSYYGVTPDLCTLGKAIGGGFPLSAIAGRADIMAHFDRNKVGLDGFAPMVGTLSGNPIAAVAGLATLKILRQPGTYEKLHSTGKAIWLGLEKSLREADIPAVVKGEPVMFDAIFTTRSDVNNYRESIDVDHAIIRRFNDLVRQHGVLKSDGKLYISVAHDDKDVRDTIAAFKASADIVAAERLAA
ncbi:aspartate aminotransferase family protein [Bosea sp. 685]|uniref:aspartate aminotransferase family protein n=1 Tax=Bosea sp. 685 TaxID=3080057 RepID=UPI002892F624|nr:aspartate aminotransferase family protein [Bosea sp. 685]WNJ88045.1 aspartate aminotransferase family protein [Bosea sp. 685]